MYAIQHASVNTHTKPPIAPVHEHTVPSRTISYTQTPPRTVLTAHPPSICTHTHAPTPPTVTSTQPAAVPTCPPQVTPAPLRTCPAQRTHRHVCPQASHSGSAPPSTKHRGIHPQRSCRHMGVRRIWEGMVTRVGLCRAVNLGCDNSAGKTSPSLNEPSPSALEISERGAPQKSIPTPPSTCCFGSGCK